MKGSKKRDEVDRRDEGNEVGSGMGFWDRRDLRRRRMMNGVGFAERRKDLTVMVTVNRSGNGDGDGERVLGSGKRNLGGVGVGVWVWDRVMRRQGGGVAPGSGIRHCGDLRRSRGRRNLMMTANCRDGSDGKMGSDSELRR